MRAELKAGNTSIFSRELDAALEQTLARGEQALLFLNRRGTATCVSCRDCGYVLTCRRCDIPVVYHRAGDVLVCHRCNRRRPMPDRCPGCAGDRIRFFGTGTQRVEQELAARFPDARVIRWDRDTTGKKGAYEELWRALHRRRGRRHGRHPDDRQGARLPARHPRRRGAGRRRAVPAGLPGGRAGVPAPLADGRPGRSRRRSAAGRSSRPTSRTTTRSRPPPTTTTRRSTSTRSRSDATHGYPPLGRLVRLLYHGLEGGRASARRAACAACWTRRSPARASPTSR